MDATATLRYYRSSPRKVRLVADLIRGQAVEPALTSLQLCRKYAAADVAKVVKSALKRLLANESISLSGHARGARYRLA